MIFEVTEEQIEFLGDSDLRTLIGYLCEQELRVHGYSPASVTWGGHQNARDGGVDVRVDLEEGLPISGYIPAAATAFQVKAQDMPRREILDEMVPEGVLRPSISDLAVRGGAYIIASSKGSLADTPLKDRRDAMHEALRGCALSGSLTVDFYDRRRIASWVNTHPGLVPWVREKVARPLSGWQSFQDWSSSPASIESEYFLDDTVRLVSPSLQDKIGLDATEGINHLRQLLHEERGAVRLVGLSGVGKTRLVQALFDERIGSSPLGTHDAIYTDISDSPDPVPLELISQLISLRHRAVLIADNCGIELHRKLVSRLSRSDAPISLVTIEYDITDDEPENTDVFRLEVASPDLIEAILKARIPALAPPSRRIIGEFCDGNARIAFALAETARDGESLADLRDSELFRRLFEQARGPTDNLMSAAKVCALLYSFDGETLKGPESELSRLAELAELSVTQLHTSIAELGRRQLVQKRSKWRAILPHAIAHRLARLALEDIPFQRIEEMIINSGSERMLRSFSKRIGYLHDDERAVALSAKWFGKDGLLEPIGNLNELGKSLFLNMAPVNPPGTLSFIEHAASSHSWSFGTENRNRKEILRVLRSISYEPELFDRSVQLLKKFACDEEDKRSDGATDILRSLFHLYLSGTHATPQQRAGFADSMLRSEDESERAIGVETLGAMLECRRFSSPYSFDFGSRSRDYGAHPNTKEAIAEWFRAAIDVAADIATSKLSSARRIRTLLASRFPSLYLRTDITDDLEAVACRLADDGGWPEGWIGIRSTLRRGRESLEPSQEKSLKELSEILRPGSLADMVRSYAFPKQWGPLDIADVEEDEDIRSIGAHQRVHDICVDLGRQLASSPEVFEELLPEILTAKSHRTRALGQGVAEVCPSLRESWDTIIAGFFAIDGSHRKPMFLAGFLNGAVARSQVDTDAFLDEVLANPDLHVYLVDLQVNAGLSGGAFDRLLSALDQRTVPLHSFEQLAYGRAHEDLNDTQMKELIGRILSKKRGFKVAVEILGMRLYGNEADNILITDELKAAARELFEKADFEAERDQSDYQLGKIAEATLDRNDQELIGIFCKHVLSAIREHHLIAWSIPEVVGILISIAPEAVLNVLVEEGNDENESSRKIFEDLREDRTCALSNVPEQVLAEWAERNPQSRYADLAQVIQYSEKVGEDKALRWTPAANRLIESAPNSADVLDIFLSRFQPTSWSGSRADILAGNVVLIESLLSHPKAEVSKWAAEKIEPYKARVDKERHHEAQHDRTRDERFE